MSQDEVVLSNHAKYRIRNRQSYIAFKSLIEKMKDASLGDQLRAIFNMMYQQKMFHYKTRAQHASESIELLIKDLNI